MIIQSGTDAIVRCSLQILIFHPKKIIPGPNGPWDLRTGSGDLYSTRRQLLLGRCMAGSVATSRSDDVLGFSGWLVGGFMVISWCLMVFNGVQWWFRIYNWGWLLVVEPTPLKHMKVNLRWFFPIYGKKHVPNHQPVKSWGKCIMRLFPPSILGPTLENRTGSQVAQVTQDDHWPCSP